MTLHPLFEVRGAAYVQITILFTFEYIDDMHDVLPLASPVGLALRATAEGRPGIVSPKP